MEIGKKDVIWNFAATTMRVASGVIVLPLVLRLLPSQEVGLWNIFLIIGGIAALMDFGFSNAFTRNVTYVFSGAKELKKEGYSIISEDDKDISYGLLRSIISAMRRYYGIIAGVFLIVFFLSSPFYLTYIFEKNNYQGNRMLVWVAWILYGILVAYQLYTYYYSSLLLGRGFIKKNQQIIIIGQGSRILSTVVFLLLGFGLLSLVIGQFISDVVNRTLCYFTFYDKDLKERISTSEILSVKEVMSLMTPNAVKVGVTIIRGFLINYATMFVASLYLSLTTIAEFGTTRQMIELISSFGMLWYNTYYPKLTFYRINNSEKLLKFSYIKANIILVFVFVILGTGLLLMGEPILTIIHSKTHLLPTVTILLFLIVALLEINSGMATSFIVTKNEVPFFKANIISGIFSIILVILLFHFTSLGVFSILLGQGLSQAVYMNWKWPYVVAKELKIKFVDYISVTKLIIVGSIKNNKK